MFRISLLTTILAATSSLAEVPNVVTDIAPIHSLTAQVMGDLGTPNLLLDPTADPHHFQLRPSQARTLASADLVVWMGEAMTPWMSNAMANLTTAESLELLEIEYLPIRIEGDVAQITARDEIPLRADENNEDHSDGHDDHSGHHHGGVDPHAWLDPGNAVEFLTAIAGQLADLDPENADTYLANAAAAKDNLAALTMDITEQLNSRRGITLVPYHDAYRYFFIRFNLRVAGSIAEVDGVPPSAARMQDVKDTVTSSDQVCLFSEPGANENLIRSLTLNPDAEIPQLNPLDAKTDLGPGFYPTLIRNMADVIAGCDA